MKQVNKDAFILFVQEQGIDRNGQLVTISDPPLMTFEKGGVIIAKIALLNSGAYEYYIDRPLDWQELLVKYMNHVVDCEGDDFLNHTSEIEFDAEEIKALKETAMVKWQK